MDRHHDDDDDPPQWPRRHPDPQGRATQIRTVTRSESSFPESPRRIHMSNGHDWSDGSFPDISCGPPPPAQPAVRVRTDEKDPLPVGRPEPYLSISHVQFHIQSWLPGPLEREYNTRHIFVCSEDDQPVVGLTSLADIARWRRRFPRLEMLIESLTGPCRYEILHFHAVLQIPEEGVSPGCNLEALFELRRKRMSSRALDADQWVCNNCVYRDGILIKTHLSIIPSDLLSPALAVPFDTSWLGDEELLSHSGPETEELIRKVTMVQEICIASNHKKATGTANRQFASDSGEIPVMVALWSFEQASPGCPGSLHGNHVNVPEYLLNSPLSSPETGANLISPSPENELGKTDGATSMIGRTEKCRNCVVLSQESKKRAQTTGLEPSTSHIDSDHAFHLHPKREEDVGISTGNKIALDKTESLEGGSASDENDRESIYPQCSNDGDERTVCIQELAGDLARAVDIYDLNHEVIHDIVKALPELLRAFALSLGQASTSQIQRDIMVFIHQSRRKIAAMFEQALLARGSEFLKQNAAKARSVDDTMWFGSQQNDEVLHGMSLPHRELADRRKSRMTQSETAKSSEDTTTPNNDSEAGSNRSQTQNYLLLIQASPAYPLLLKRIRRERMIALPEPRSGAGIRETILEALPKAQRIRRRAPSQTFNVAIKTHWDPVIFVEEQRYEQTADYAFERVITTTGCFSSAQALTIREYMDQTWPCTGCEVLSLVKTTITKGVKESVTLVDGTRVTCTRGTFTGERSSHQMLFEIIGTGPAIAEIGEQVAWMASALRTCPLEGTVAHSKPIVHTTRPQNVGHSPQSAFIFELTVELRESIKSMEPVNGQCWHRMMASPVVVEGFPIRRRPSHASEGLELPLNMLAQLVDTTRVSVFDEKTLLKGFTSMAIVTGYSQNFVSWHFTQENQGRMSHLRSEEWPGLSVAVHALKAARHVVGWCPEIKLFAGQQGAIYSIGNSGLPSTIEEEEPFSTSTLSAGPIFADGIRPVLGQRDIRAPRSSFIKKMKWLFQKYIVLWDEADQRGWLVNGASALLHLVRASIYKDRCDRAPEAARPLHEDQLHEAKRPYQWDSAFQLLVHPINRKINMSGSGENLITFQDRAEDYFTLLEQAIDIRIRATSRHSPAGKQPRSVLDGWDFRDLTWENRPIYRRQTVLPLEGRSWVDLTRAIYAVTLFGRGFGDIIRPADWLQTFAGWKTVPTGRFYLTASARDIRNIAEANGDPDSYPARLTHDLLWCSTKASNTHPLQNFKERCKSMEHVNMLVPVAMLNEAQETTVASDWDVGAMVFGFNPDDAWYWGDYGYPTRSKPTVQEMGPFYSGDSAGDSQIPSIYEGARRSSAGGVSQTMEQVFFNMTNSTAGRSEHILHEPSNRKMALAHYTVGIICALQNELMAVRVLFDDVFEPVTMPTGDHNHYVLGRIAEHHVVGVCLQYGSDSTYSARNSVHYLKRGFPGIRFCLLVGMGAGTPFDAHDIRLGDVIISSPRSPYSGVIPYDIAQTPASGPFTLNGSLSPPPTDLTQAIRALESNPDGATASLDRYIRQIDLLKIQYQRPDPEADRHFLSCYSHALPSDTDCHRCWSMFELRRPPRPTLQPRIHYGLIASSTAIPRAGYHRDLLIKAHNILCFETEAAGIVDVFPCVLIRGICDYGDSHRNTRWQHYAAATAAAYAKVLLTSMRGVDINGYEPAHVYENEIGGRDPVERKRRRESPDSGAGVGSSKRPGMFYGV